MARIENNTLKTAVAALMSSQKLESIQSTAEGSQTDSQDPDGYMYGFPIFSESYDSSSIESEFDEEDEDCYEVENSYYHNSCNDEFRASVPKREERRLAAKKHKRALVRQKSMVYKEEFSELVQQNEAEYKESAVDKYFANSNDDDSEADEEDEEDTEEDNNSEEYNIAMAEEYDALYLSDYTYNAENEHDNLDVEANVEKLATSSNDLIISSLFVKLKCWSAHPSKEHFDPRRRNNSKLKRKKRKIELAEMYQLRLQYIGKRVATV